MRLGRCGWIMLGVLLGYSIGHAQSISISPSSLPDGTVGVPYSQTLKASGCSGVCVWSSTGTLPPGLSLGTANGVISGTPSQAGSFPFTVTATDARLQTGSQAYTVNVNGGLTITTSSPLPDGKVGVAYSQMLTASGGTSPYTWSVTSGTLPPGISLNSSTGALSGTPTSANLFTFTVQVADRNRTTASAALSLTISAAAPPLTITTGSALPGGTVGTPYSQSISASGGTPPYAWAATGALPPGLSVNASTGALTGTPTSANTFNFTLQVTDSANVRASKAFTLTIAPNTPKLTISTTSLPDGTAGVGYSQVLTATGGTPPYNWALTSGALPGGLNLDSKSGTIGGTPTAAGTFPFSVRVTDSASAVADQGLQITVGAAPPTPTLSFTGVSSTAASGQQIPFDLNLSSPSSQQVNGQITLSFQPNAVAAADDPAIQFSGGSRTATFNIPANATKAAFSVSGMAFQTGTVAGTITLAVSSDLPGGNFSRTVVVARAAPVIQSATVTTSGSGFQVQVAGFSNTRELSGASFHFTAASGQTVQTSDLSVSLATLASQWYTGSTSIQFGGQFLLVVPFTVSQGAASGLSSVAVQIQNGQSTSTAATAKF